MLKNIPSILSPELLKILMEMGHSDEIVIGDGNFPAASNAKRLIRCDGHGVPELLDAILQLFPLDTYVESPVMLMQVTPGDDVVSVVQTRTLFLVADEEVGDLQLQQRARRVHQFLAVYYIVAVDRSEEHVTVTERNRTALRYCGLVDTVEGGEGREDLLAHVERTDDMLCGEPGVAALVEGDAADLV